MYIIFKGSVSVNTPNVVAIYKEKEFLGRSALEND